ncbi:unnamed protein product [Pieris macdunnoughi]|uniref:Uncharacterized protein n=1 Tax=Pieris macdunnoughi TaxID=345717 RepID=A0A821R379_9NEOP|nr:unnamed protein product [Pieris macdunnoughi]
MPAIAFRHQQQHEVNSDLLYDDSRCGVDPGVMMRLEASEKQHRYHNLLDDDHARKSDCFSAHDDTNNIINSVPEWKISAS